MYSNNGKRTVHYYEDNSVAIFAKKTKFLQQQGQRVSQLDIRLAIYLLSSTHLNKTKDAKNVDPKKENVQKRVFMKKKKLKKR